jgi:Fur family transcriptional regulator, ferric uptake regulator
VEIDVNRIKQTDSKIKSTKQRELIISELCRMSSHPTAEELYLKLKSRMPTIGLCTVYRNLETFCEKGLIFKIKGNPVRYDGNTKAHNHIKCIECGRVDDLYSNIAVNSLEIKKLGYKLLDHKLEINGLCSKCYKKTLSEKKRRK